MKKIPSFEVNHLTLIPGVYVSRIDHVGNETLTTYDLRMTRPNYEYRRGTLHGASGRYLFAQP